MSRTDRRWDYIGVGARVGVLIGLFKGLSDAAKLQQNHYLDVHSVYYQGLSTLQKLQLQYNSHPHVSGAMLIGIVIAPVLCLAAVGAVIGLVCALVAKPTAAVAKDAGPGLQSVTLPNS